MRLCRSVTCLQGGPNEDGLGTSLIVSGRDNSFPRVGVARRFGCVGAGEQDRERFLDPSNTIYEFVDEVLVRCPDCGGCAVVFAHLGEREQLKGEDGSVRFRRRLRCLACGLFKDAYPRSSLVGASVDPYFRFPLWLQAACCGEVLWAYNFPNLDLESYLGARLRERGSDPDSMLAKLPAGLKSAKHREEILHVIQRLCDSVPVKLRPDNREREDQAESPFRSGAG